MRINYICNKLGINNVENNHFVFSITDDSKSCIDNSVFFAIKGNNCDGHTKINEAIKNGARTIVLSSNVLNISGINYIYVENVKRMYAMFMKIFNKKYVKNLKIIGVIGTNGKTTCSTLIYKYLQSDYNAMLIGSNGCYYGSYEKKHNNTTPGIYTLYKYFKYAYEHKIKFIVMEVSSIAISELRVLGISFDTLVFTNFSEDHLDYHKTMDAYFHAKTIPFFKLRMKQNAIINFDDEKGREILDNLECKTYTYSLSYPAMIMARNITSSFSGIDFSVDLMKYHSNLLGKFNVYNILPLFAIKSIYKVKESIFEFLNNFSKVNGRMNLLQANKSNVIIDYAHTEEAVKKAIIETYELCEGKLYVVIGCGGNREREKRGKIGELLNGLKCIPIITSDNPRFEDPKAIISDITANMNCDYMVIENRMEAISYALDLLKDKDCLLILGKGAEDYIDILGHKETYSDYEVVNSWLNRR